MGIPQEVVAAVRAKVTDWSPGNDAIAAALNAPDPNHPNPVAQTQVPKPFTFADVMGKLSDGAVAAVRDTPNTTDLIDKINAGDRAGVAHWVLALEKAPAKIDATEAQAVMGVIQATEPDPSYQPNLSWAQATVGRPLTHIDVADARPNGA